MREEEGEREEEREGGRREVTGCCTHSLRFMICSNGRRKSFWKRKFASSPFSRNFMDSCRRESTTKKGTSSFGRQPTWRRDNRRSPGNPTQATPTLIIHVTQPSRHVTQPSRHVTQSSHHIM